MRWNLHRHEGTSWDAVELLGDDGLVLGEVYRGLLRGYVALVFTTASPTVTCHDTKELAMQHVEDAFLGAAP